MSTKNILILEDDVEFAETVAERLEYEGHKVVIITEAKALPSTMREHDINFILSDIMLEETIGFDILKLLKFKQIQIPVVFMTGFDGIKELSAAMEDQVVIDGLSNPSGLNR